MHLSDSADYTVSADDTYENATSWIELIQLGCSRFAALVKERAETSDSRAALLRAKREVIRHCSNVHVEAFFENDSECRLEYSVLLAAASPDEAKDELCCILHLLDAEAARLSDLALSV